MIKVYQIAIGTVPEKLNHCMESVKKFAKRNGFEYCLLTEVPQQYREYKDVRVLSNYMRVDLLASDPCAIYFDWDVLLDDEFQLTFDNAPLFNRMGDNVMYSGNVEFWKKVRMWMGDIKEYRYELPRIFNALRSGVVRIEKEMIIEDKHFKHTNFSGSKNGRS
jgi:hypothetical protein